MTEGDTVPDWVTQAAQEGGAISRDCYRVVVIESDSKVSVKDFEDRKTAEQYANDAASESDHPTPLAYVFGDAFQLVARGRHYAAR